MNDIKIPAMVIETIKLGIKDSLYKISKNHSTVKKLVIALRTTTYEAEIIEHQKNISMLKKTSLTAALRVVKLTDTLNLIKNRGLFSGEVEPGDVTTPKVNAMREIWE